MKTYTKREMAHLLGCSPRTIHEDINHLGLAHVKSDRNCHLYNERDLNLITQLRQHCGNKRNSRDSFVPLTVPELVEDEVKITKITPREQNNSISNFESYIQDRLIVDPFFDLELLQRISDKKWLLPAQRLAPIFGIKAKYLNTLKQYNYCGFIATKEIYATDNSRLAGFPPRRVLQNRALWKIKSNNS